jgi:creatinine amidohydrolase
MDLYTLRWPQVQALPRTMPVVFPVAALEQHGHHMPVFTDSLLLGEVMRRVQQTLNGKCLFAPLQWLGNSHHHLDFPGTLSASPRVYLDTLIDLAECFLRHGFTRIVYVNGHGGNSVPMQQATFELRQELRDRRDLLLVSATYWGLGGKPWEAEPALQQREMGHACEWETSMMLRIRPELVSDPASTTDVPFGTGFGPAYRAWTMPDRSEPGHVGDPRSATAEKGEALFRVFAADVTSFLERVIAWDGKAWDA